MSDMGRARRCGVESRVWTRFRARRERGVLGNAFESAARRLDASRGAFLALRATPYGVARAQCQKCVAR
eukprot:7792703-Lingulodinium_polyedra.AAC.1